LGSIESTSRTCDRRYLIVPGIGPPLNPVLLPPIHDVVIQAAQIKSTARHEGRHRVAQKAPLIAHTAKVL
jgi:hypothetical protein